MNALGSLQLVKSWKNPVRTTSLQAIAFFPWRDVPGEEKRRGSDLINLVSMNSDTREHMTFGKDKKLTRKYSRSFFFLQQIIREGTWSIAPWRMSTKLFVGTKLIYSKPNVPSVWMSQCTAQVVSSFVQICLR